MKINSPEFHQVMGGHIPWSAEGVRQVAERAAELHHLPHDDWDRIRQGSPLMLDEEGNRVPTLRVNIDRMENQIAFYIMDMYRDEPEIVRASHVNRWLMIIGFLLEHTERLRREGLEWEDEDDPEASQVAQGLWETLAMEPYPVRVLDETGKLHHHEYDVDDVIEKAVRRQKELETTADGEE